MAYSLGAKSLAELVGVHPEMGAVPKLAITLTKQDFSVHDGLRTVAEQREYLRTGVSTTMNSKHLKQADGFGHAWDLVPWINGMLRWEWKPIFVIAVAVQQAREQLGVELIWGGVWDTPFSALGKTAADFERAVNAYVERRKRKGKRAFIDGPHWQMA